MSEEKFMKRAIELAERGLGSVSPNPVVGCVIVHQDKIIGEGYHKKYGEAHAEVNAINAVQNPELLPESTVYVTLEPCAHHGKTPPCADLLIDKKVKKVVVASRDPFPEVDGRGIERMEKAGIVMEIGCLNEESRWVNRRFFTNHELKRPYVILKWAQTKDGFVARENFDSKWISNEYSRKLVHKWRSEEDAILVGTNTAKFDNPSLTVRDWEGKNPIRVVIDRHLVLKEDLNVFDGSVKTLIFNTIKSEKGENVEFVQFDGTLDSLLGILHERKIGSVFVEGGSQFLKSFIEEELWDEARVFTSEVNFGKGMSVPKIEGELIEDHEETGDRLQIYISESNG